MASNAIAVAVIERDVIRHTNIIFALILASLVNIAISNIFKTQVKLPISPILPSISWLLAVGLGLIMPIIANIVPVRRALSSRLRDALDL